jgi:phage regulator Rha-like protein
MERFVYMEKSKAEREGPEKRAQRLMATVSDTVETLAVLPSRRYGVAEWLMTHRLLLSHPPPPLPHQASALR